MRGGGHPLVLAINGRAEIVVQDAAAYQKLLDRVDELEALEGIQRGLADIAAGRVTPLREFEKEFRSKHGLRSLCQREVEPACCVPNVATSIT